MHLLGIVGWSGSGKTTLVEKLLPLLAGHGLTVSTIKRSHHGFDVDKPGKDSWRHRKAGAHEVLVASDLRWALMRENRSGAETTLDELVARLEPVDLVLVEGFTNHPHARIEVWRAAEGKALRSGDDAGLLAIAAPRPDWKDGDGHRWLDLDDAAAVAAFIVQWAKG
ncbi:MAG: molybdopterin-guanine dinucleotide biosynthesis protein B [Alphaproteobacteria bacterium]|nr:molybdopterin-guanine dinucleotide biosynthesis protein B [Alphaproteobacteria bacterium]MCW5740661.1 molybdopterin-guanine dinucleotide biosynthesis protein B [Alphaproteobacteria bacterium]